MATDPPKNIPVTRRNSRDFFLTIRVPQSNIPRGVPKTATEQRQTGSDDRKYIRHVDLSIEIPASRLSVFPVIENVDAQQFNGISHNFGRFVLIFESPRLIFGVLGGIWAHFLSLGRIWAHLCSLGGSCGAFGLICGPWGAFGLHSGSILDSFWCHFGMILTSF